ncbi:MAG: hypothetical protein KC609_10215, partial [Myxococcales bacterium]|nr:hypothetical protein [Myxococcales bacterium]
ALLARIFPFRATLFEHVAHEEVRDWLAYSVSLFWPLVEWSAGRGATGAADLARWLLGRIAASAAERAVGRERAADAAVCGESLGAAMVIASRHLIATSNVAMPLVLARPLASQKPRLRALFVDPAVTTRLGLSWYDGVEWFNREATLELWRWVSSLAGVCALGAGPPSPSSVVDLSEAIVDRATELETLSDEVGYRYQGLVSRFSVPSTLTRNDPPPR